MLKFVIILNLYQTVMSVIGYKDGKEKKNFDAFKGINNEESIEFIFFNFARIIGRSLVSRLYSRYNYSNIKTSNLSTSYKH